MVKVYISSTYSDLKSYRSAVISALRRMNHHVVCMEDYGATDQRPLDKCLSDVDQCEVYVGLFAWRYGYVPNENNPGGKSITELEYQRAIEHKKECLVFILNPEQPWSPMLMDDGPDKQRLEALGKELEKRHMLNYFRTESDLATHVATAVHNYIARQGVSRADPAPRDENLVPVPRVPIGTTGLQRAFRGHADLVECVAVSKDSSRAASGSWDRTIRVWDLESGRTVGSLKGHTGSLAHPGVVYRVLFKPDGSQLISCGYDGTIRIWDLTIFRELRQLAGHEGRVTGLALANDGRHLVSTGDDRTVRLWSLDTYHQSRQLKGHRGSVRCIAISSDARLALSGGADGQLCLWDLTKGEEIPRFKPTDAVSCVDLAPNGSIALSAGIDAVISLWDVQSGLLIRRFVCHTQTVRTAVMSSDLRRMLSGSNDGSMRLWDLSSGAELVRYDDHRCPVVAVALSADGLVAVSGAADNIVRLWRLPR